MKKGYRKTTHEEESRLKTPEVKTICLKQSFINVGDDNSKYINMYHHGTMSDPIRKD